VFANWIADLPKAIGAGLAEAGFFLDNVSSSCSTFRCSCVTGWLGAVMQGVSPTACEFHSLGVKRQSAPIQSALSLAESSAPGLLTHLPEQHV